MGESDGDRDTGHITRDTREISDSDLCIMDR